MGGKVDNGYRKLFFNQFCRLYTIDISLDVDIHQNEVGLGISISAFLARHKPTTIASVRTIRITYRLIYQYA
jgi:hypothetical protein